MKSLCLYTFIFFYYNLICQEHNTSNDSCLNLKDSTIQLNYSVNKDKSKFYQLISYIEKKSDFSRYNRRKLMDSSENYNILLQKLRCPERHFNSTILNYKLIDIFSISYMMTSKKNLKNIKGLYPQIKIIQLNFANEFEKAKCLILINEIGWGDPKVKWNDYTIINDDLRIIILESFLAGNIDNKLKLEKLIKNWLKTNKNNTSE